MTDTAKNNNKWTRRNIVALWDGQPWSTNEDRIANMAECDRIFIALHRFQTIGKISYRRLLGMHGGGGGTSCTKFREILELKVKKDLEGHSGYSGEFPEDGFWPSPVPNSPPPTKVCADEENRCFTYTFCWHAQPEFLLWHRALMAEFERNLQEYDPKYDHVKESEKWKCHKGPDAIAAPYWGWEGWDGLSLPQVLSNNVYVLKTNEWKDQGFPKGSIFPNPFYRWFAPVALEDQVKEFFPSTLSDHNTTQRASAFTDYGAEFSYPWEQVSTSPARPSMQEVVSVAIQNNNWLEFCTMNPEVGGGAFSIENAHNKFHNHVGGKTKGGIQGSGEQTANILPDDDPIFTGTMAQNQSIFDPIFWLHHSNVERQLISWQRYYAIENTTPDPVSIPSRELMSRVLYPWTKPRLLFNEDRFSWNTKSSSSTDATFEDWWPHTTLPYEYDEYLEPQGVVPTGIIPFPPKRIKNAIRMIVFFDLKSYRGGEYDLYYTPDGRMQLVGAVSVLSGVGNVCGRCAHKKEGAVAFEVSEFFPTIEEATSAFKEGNLRLIRTDMNIKIGRIEVKAWCNN